MISMVKVLEELTDKVFDEIHTAKAVGHSGAKSAVKESVSKHDVGINLDNINVQQHVPTDSKTIVVYQSGQKPNYPITGNPGRKLVSGVPVMADTKIG